MATSLDTALIDAYVSGMNVPLASQAGYPCQANSPAGTNVEYVGPQMITGSGVWNGKARSILVGGSGARGIALVNSAPYVGYEVRVIDAAGNAGSGTITVSVTAGTLAGTTTITSDYGSRLYCYVGGTTWALIG